MVYSFAKNGQLESLRIGNAFRFTAACGSCLRNLRGGANDLISLREVAARFSVGTAMVYKL